MWKKGNRTYACILSIQLKKQKGDFFAFPFFIRRNTKMLVMFKILKKELNNKCFGECIYPLWSFNWYAVKGIESGRTIEGKRLTLVKCQQISHSQKNRVQLTWSHACIFWLIRFNDSIEMIISNEQKKNAKNSERDRMQKKTDSSICNMHAWLRQTRTLLWD